MSQMGMSLPAGRYFLALWPPPWVRGAIAAAARDWLHDARDACRPMDPGRYHLTLAFLGDLDEARAARLAACAGPWSSRPMKPFTITLDRSGQFGSRVAWLGCSEPAPGLMALHDALGRELRHADLADGSPRDFLPHVTLARDMQGDWPASPPVRGITWSVHRFVLVRSLPEMDHAYRIVMSSG